MKIKSVEMENFLGIERLEIDIPDEGLVLICGANGSGKSTLLDAIRFVLAGRGGRGNSAEFCDDGRLLRQGAHEGMVSLEVSDNKYGSRLSRNVSDGIVSDPSLVMSAGGKPYGLFPGRFFGLGKDARRMALLRAAGIEPSDGLLEKALRQACAVHLPEDNALEAAAKAVLGDYENAGFAHAEAGARDKVRGAKRKWQQVTGERWGAKKAVSWMPERSSDIDIEKETARLNGLRAALSGLWRDRQDAFSNQADSLKKDCENLRSRKERLVELASTQVIDCPNCCLALRAAISDGSVKLTKNSAVSSEFVSQAKLDLNGVCGEIHEMQDDISLFRDLSKCIPEPLHEMATNRLAIFFGSDISDDDKEHWLAAAREERALSATLKEASQAYIDSKSAVIAAANVHREILLWLALADVVSPGGLPRQLTTPAVDAVNAAARELSEALGLGWNAELLHSDMSLAGEGLVSASEGWLVDLAVAIGMSRGAPFLLVDGMEVLQTHATRRGKLLSFLMTKATRGDFGQAFVAATLKSAPSPIPGQLGVIELPIAGHEPDHYLA